MFPQIISWSRTGSRTQGDVTYNLPTSLPLIRDRLFDLVTRVTGLLMLSLRVYARLCTQSRAACICVFGSRVARHREAHHRCRIQRCTRHPSPKLIAVPTVSCPASKGGGGGGTFLVFERRDIRGSYHPPQGCFKLANFFHSTWIYGFRH